MTVATQIQSPDTSHVLNKAFANATDRLGVTRESAASILGVSRTTLARHAESGFDPMSKQGELSLLFVRMFRSLSAISGGDQAFMRHWFTTQNTGLGGIPAELVQTINGLYRSIEYLDAMRGKT